MVPTKHVSRGWVACVVATLLLAFAAAPASAAAPGNDDRASATPVGALPFNDHLVTLEATSQEGDPPCASDPGVNPTVWYSFTPSQDGRYIATTRGSDYDTTLWVGTNASGLDRVACNDDHFGFQSMVAWRARAGVTYLIMVGSFRGEGGDLRFRIKRAPRPPTFRLSLERARLTGNGKIELRGGLSCQRSESVLLEAAVRQDFGRHIIRGWRSRSLRCGADWVVQLGNPEFRFAREEARISLNARTCNAAGCRRTTIDRIVEVR